jgi:hypothetical protein
VAHGKLAELHQELKEDSEKSTARLEREYHGELSLADLGNNHVRLQQHAKRSTKKGDNCRSQQTIYAFHRGLNR